MKNLFIIMLILLNFHSYGMKSEGKEEAGGDPSTLQTSPIASPNADLSILQELEKNTNAIVISTYNNMTLDQQKSLALKVINRQYTTNDRYVKYFWKPIAKLSDIIENMAILGTVVFPSVTTLFNGNERLSQILSCSCGAATMIFKGIRGYTEQKVVEAMNQKLCLSFLQKTDAGEP